MIRASDLASAATWARPAISAPRADARGDASTWFGAASAVAPAITGDLNPAARGLNVEQHAAAILAHLCGEQDL